MGRYVLRLPDVGEGVAEAEIVVWHVKSGDVVKQDQSLVDLMTDKATVDMSSPVDGVVTSIHGEPGKMLPVGSVLIEFEVHGDGNVTSEPTPGVSATPKPAPSASAEVPLSTGSRPKLAVAPAATASVQTGIEAFSTRQIGDAPLAAPATRRRAYDLGVELQHVPGTGPAGRITDEDLDAYIAAGGAAAVHAPVADAAFIAKAGINHTQIIGLRRRIGEKMQESKRRIPHITYVEECDLTELERLRADLNAHRTPEQPKLTMLPFLMRALVRALMKFPQMNARYDDDEGVLHAHEGVHIGIATQTPAGLMVPVVRHAEARTLWDCARDIIRISRAARDGSAARDELSDSTITITSLGPLGGIATTPIINHPEVAIIGPNKLVDRPMIDGSFVSVRKMMNLSSAFDHRIIDGYDAARFIQLLKRLLEHPALIFMD